MAYPPPARPLCTSKINDVRAPLELRASLILGAPFALHALQASFTSFPSDGLGVSKIGHF